MINGSGKKWQSRLIAFSITAIFVTIGTSIIFKVFRDNVVFFYSPSELKAKPPSKDQMFRVGGLVKENSLKPYDSEGSIEFKVSDLETELIVIYRGIIPNLFKEGQGAVAYGKLREDGVFIATEILAKHDENYMPPAVERSLKKTALQEKIIGE